MSRDDWFRCKSWTDEDRRQFFERLARSRSRASKAQYVRIQALHLAEVGEMQGAIKLLQQLFAELPEPSELATAHVQMAECLMAMDQRENALNAYRTALRVEKEFPQRRTNAWLDFPWLVVTKRMRQLYSEARSFLEWGNRQPRFPIEEYKLATVEAFMAEDEGSVGTAKRFARIALNVAQRTHSGFRYHPTLGLVKDQEQEVKERLEKLAR